MRVFVEVGPNVRVTGAAHVAAGEAGRRERRLRLSVDQRGEKQDEDAETPQSGHSVQYSGERC
jgi:hypothetical protein